MICDNCKSAIFPDEHFCSNCGTENPNYEKDFSLDANTSDDVPLAANPGDEPLQDTPLPDDYSFVIKLDPGLLIIKIIFTEIAISVIDIGWLFITLKLGMPFFIIFGGILFLIIFQVITGFWIKKDWQSETYEIKNGTIKHVKGFLSRTEENIEFHKIDSITLTKSIMEKIFRSGTIRIYEPLQEKVIVMEDVAEPEVVVAELQRHLHKLI